MQYVRVYSRPLYRDVWVPPTTSDFDCSTTSGPPGHYHEGNDAWYCDQCNGYWKTEEWCNEVFYFNELGQRVDLKENSDLPFDAQTYRVANITIERSGVQVYKGNTLKKSSYSRNLQLDNQDSKIKVTNQTPMLEPLPKVNKERCIVL